ncbi:Os11g0567600 [Oryza sativa Japonica Group]|uniref:Os11g0567600 protein n=2 Tax=Oryza TaxID=4527 RepID=C7J945_ORYSJ|nr:Os11g0567600 [Oryza sativa Japonica Group]|eukprot:NP_001176610.1 Os11g0567600 [Oryza sativa Japonica Group]
MLTGLNHLDLSYNNLAGDITEEHFANLRSLKYIDLSSNDPLNIVVDPTWIAPFRLERASFPACMMGPQFPTWLQWSVDIWLLEISNTGIKDKLPDWFWTTFSKLEELDMSNNQISGVLPTNMETMALSYLYLGSNQISEWSITSFTEKNCKIGRLQ